MPDAAEDSVDMAVDTAVDTAVDIATVRRAVLAAAVLDESPVTVDPRAGDDLDDRAVVVVCPAGRHLLSWRDVAVSLGMRTAEPTHPVTRARVAALVQAGVLLAEGGPQRLLDALHRHVEHPASPRHPGPGWADARLGDAGPQVGWGLDVPSHELTLPLPHAPGVRAALSTLPREAWDRARARAQAEVERLGVALVERLARDDAEGRDVVLRPMAHSDVLTLLLSPSVRRWAAQRDRSGLASVAAPTRHRGWLDLRRVDPVYVGAAHRATPALDRAAPVPLLVTVDEVTGPLSDPVVDPLRDGLRRG